MATKIGLISDPHAHPGPVAEALSIFEQNRVEHIFCAGDIAGYGDRLDETIELLKTAGCRAVVGNHEAWYLEKITSTANTDQGVQNSSSYNFIQGLPVYLEMRIEGVSIYMVHAAPPDLYEGGIRLLDENGELLGGQVQHWSQQLSDFDYDVLVVGHTHQVFAQQLGHTLVINPGSTRYNHTCAILSLPDLQLEVTPLGDQTPVLSWNWGINEARP